MTRKYTLGKRADRQADTRRRIVEATVALHGDVGPAATTRSMIAERAGVQRHTLYAHFPDERSLFLACSGLSLERDPLPDAASGPAITDLRERLLHGLGELYGWYARNEALLACVLRDAEHHPLTREIADLRFGPVMASYGKVLGAGMSARQRALMAVALRFPSFRTLVQDARLSPRAAAETMTDAVCALGAGPRTSARRRRGPG